MIRIIFTLGLIFIISFTSAFAQELSSFKAHTRSYGLDAAFFGASSQKVLTGGQDGQVNLWDLEGKQLLSIEAHPDKKIYALAVAPNGKYFASSGNDKLVKIWDAKNGKLVHEITALDYARRLVFSPDSRYVLAAESTPHIEIWEVKSAKRKHNLQGKGITCFEAAFSPDGKQIVAGCGIDLKYWDFESGEEIAVFEDLKFEPDAPRPRKVNSAIFSPNGQQVLTWYDGDYNFYEKHALMQLWDLNGQLVQKFSGITGGFEALFSPDQKYIISGGSHHNVDFPDRNHGNLNVFSLETGKLLVTVPAHKNGVGGIDISPDGKRLLSFGSKDREVKIWDLPQLVEMRDKPATSLSKNPDPSPASEDDEDELAGFEDLLEDQKDIKYYALIISVQDYASDDIKDLSEPQKDATRLVEVLQKQYTFETSDVSILQDPTRSEIITSLDELSQTVRPQDNLLIFYAGHGYWDEKLEQGYWLPSDSEKGLRANWLSNSDIATYIRGIPSRHTLLITDACFGGSIFETDTRAAFSVEDAPKHIKNLYERPSRSALTSGAKEEVPDKSVFMDYLIKGLQQNDQKFMTTQELYAYLRIPVTANAPNAPQYQAIRNTKHEGGEFIFVQKTP